MVSVSGQGDGWCGLENPLRCFKYSAIQLVNCVTDRTFYVLTGIAFFTQNIVKLTYKIVSIALGMSSLPGDHTPTPLSPGPVCCNIYNT